MLPDYAALSPELRNRARRLAILRGLCCALLVAGLDHIIELGTAIEVLMLAALIGSLAGSRLSFSPIRHRSFLLGLALLYLLFEGITWLFTFLPGNTPRSILAPVILFSHVWITVLIALVSTLLSWLFWRCRAVLTLEVIGLISGSIYFLSGHRNFHFDQPKALNSLAWELGISELGMLLSISCLVTLFVIFYLNASSFLGSERDGRILQTSWHQGTFGTMGSIVLLLIISTIFYLIYTLVQGHFFKVALTRIANGVGQSNEEGLSPLSFESALGTTNQPALLVRLDSDYRENPFAPMLYLRESALSKYNGHELIRAGKAFDTDLNFTTPEEHFRGTEDPTLLQRVPIVQSYYLMAEHKTAVALDYPLSINPLNNPNPSRFRNAYRVYSSAPGFIQDDALALPVGDPRWSADIRAHYLEKNQDSRYELLARTITDGITQPVEQAKALSNFLTEKAIYTLTPNHKVDAGADPTAAFLFGDLRGYCVHFAHAMTYMLRSLGIPARIGTGYLTDLSQSKDGHILLRMSDRHAWAEVYIADHGWIPFDVQPKQVESHADSQVDMGLLEELMGMLDPGEEILPKESGRDEIDTIEDDQNRFPTLKVAGALILGIICFITICKLYLRYGWVLTRNPTARLRSSYIAAASLLRDLGISRELAETRSEFQKRVESEIRRPALILSPALIESTYNQSESTPRTLKEIDLLRKNDLKTIKESAGWKRILAIINPTSVFSFLNGKAW